MTHPKSETRKLGDVTIKCESFKRNLWFYKSIGGKVTVRGKKKNDAGGVCGCANGRSR